MSHAKRFRKISVGCKAKLDETAEYKEIAAKVKNLRRHARPISRPFARSDSGRRKQVKCLRMQETKLTAVCKDALVQAGLFDLPPPAAAAPAAAAPAPAAPAAAAPAALHRQLRRSKLNREPSAREGIDGCQDRG